MNIFIDIQSIITDLKYDNIEFIHRDKSIKVTSQAKIYIPDLHEYLCGKIFFKLKSNKFPISKYIGVLCIRNNEFNKRRDLVIKNILPSQYIGKAEFYDLNGIKPIGSFKYKYMVECLNTCNEEYDDGNVLRYVFDIFFSNTKSQIFISLSKNFDDILLGSYKCKFNFLFGIICLEKFLSKVHYKNTRNLQQDKLNFIKCDIINDSKGISNKYPLEKFLLPPNISIKYIKPDDNSIVQDDIVEYGILQYKGIYNQLKSTITNNLVYDTIYWTLNGTNININELLYTPKVSIPLEKVLDNSDYIVAPKLLLTKLVDNLYYCIAAYGNTWPNLFCTKRKDIQEPLDQNRKAVLEYLGIENSRLLSINKEEEDIPNHIIFLEKDRSRIVISFKGTSSSDEALKDVDCKYTPFQNGFVHKGMSILADSFVKKKTQEILKYCNKCKVKSLLLTGHSLGGSVSILCHLMYKQMNEMKDFSIKTMAFAPAPVISYNLTTKIHSDIFIINYGNDVIPRLSFGSVCELKYFACSIGNSSSLFNYSNMDDIIKKISCHMSTLKAFPKLYFPGILYHIKKVNCTKEGKTSSIILYKQVDASFYDTLLVVKHTTLHHMPAHILNALTKGISDMYD